MRSCIRGIAAVLAVGVALAGRVLGAADQMPSADEILESGGVRAGLCVRIGTTDGRLETGLTSNGRMLVHGLALSAASVQEARATIRAAGLYGLASVERASTLDRLPYADNLVNLLVADLDALGQKAPAEEEILRVVCPGGVAYTKHGGKWTARRKPRPQQIDDWTHFGYGPEGNGLSRDRLVKPPQFVQWISEVQPLTMEGHPSQWLPFFAGLRVAGGRVVFAWGTRGPRGWETCCTGRDGAVPSDRKTPGLPGGPVAEDMVRQRRAAGLETSPVEVDGKTFVAVIQQHRLECRDSDRKILWSYTAGGRISTPPVVHQGLCLFGSHDGWVYCLRAADGALRWRFMAAPYERKMVAHSQLKSSWPVYSVTLHQGLVCFSAGLHPELGGGIYVYGLEPESGKLVWKKVLQAPGVVHKGRTRTQVAPNRILNDVLESDGKRLSLPGIAFDPEQPDGGARAPVEVTPRLSRSVRRGQ